MAKLWSEEAKYNRWLDVELAVCRAWRRAGRIPAKALREIESRARFDVDHILAWSDRHNIGDREVILAAVGLGEPLPTGDDGPLLEDFVRKGLRTEAVIGQMRCEGCGHLLGYKTWGGTPKLWAAAGLQELKDYESPPNHQEL